MSIDEYLGRQLLHDMIKNIPFVKLKEMFQIKTENVHYESADVYGKDSVDSWMETKCVINIPE